MDFSFLGKKNKEGGDKPATETVKKVEYEDKFIDYLLPPSKIEEDANEILVGDKYHRVLCAVGYPRMVDSGWLARLVEMNMDFDLSIYLRPYPVESTLQILDNQLKKQTTDIYTLQSSGRIVPQELIAKHDDTLALIEVIQKGEEKLFDMSLYIDAKAYDKKTLNHTVDRVRAIMNSLMIIPRIPNFQMSKAVRSCLPIEDNEINITRNITSSGAAACFPFVITSLEKNPSGILIGFSYVNNIPIILDPFTMANPNILVLGTSGGGKSYTIKLMIMREYLEGVEVNIIDPQGEYTDLVVAFGGEVIRIASDSENIINPMDLLGQTLDEKKLSLLAFFTVILGGKMDESKEAIIETAIDNAYAKKGITQDPTTWSNEPPILEDVYKEIAPLMESSKTIISNPAIGVTNVLKEYVYGPLRFINKHTLMKLEKKMVSFDICDVPSVAKSVFMFLILEYVYNQMKTSKKRKMLVIDEAWTVLSSGGEAEYVRLIVKTCRKFNLSLNLITQDVEDLLNSEAGRAVLHNTAVKLLLKQDPTLVDQIVETFHLTEADKRFLSTAQVGSVLIIAQNTRVPIYIEASPDEHRIITTNPDEILAMQKDRAKAEEAGGEESMGISKAEEVFDLTKSLYEKDQLTDYQLTQLEDLGYEEIRVPTLKKGTEKLLLIKNTIGEENWHFALRHLVINEIEKYTKRVQPHYTALPDITFETADMIIAVEIETDTSRIAENINSKMNLLKRYDEYFIVVNDVNMVEEFRDLGTIVHQQDCEEKIRSYFKA